MTNFSSSGSVSTMRLFGALLSPVLIMAGAAAPNFASDQPAQEHASALVEQALEADLAGDAAQRAALLAEAIQADPESSAGHWQRGDVFFDDEWRSLSEVQSIVTADERRREYRELRASLGDAAEDHRTLARWCSQRGLAGEARYHWASLMLAAPGDDEARDRLDLREYRGRLYTGEQVAELQQLADDYEKNLRAFQPVFIRLVRDAVSGGPAKREEALAAIRDVRVPAALPALEYVITVKAAGNKGLLRRLPEAAREQLSIDLHLALLVALENLRQHEATVDLVNYAVFSPWPEVRTRAAEALKPRAPTDYVPLLMSGLRAPIDAEIQWFAAPDGTVMLTETVSTAEPGGEVVHTRTTNYGTDGAMNHDPRRSSVSAVLARHLSQAEALAVSTQENAEATNAQSAERNQRIFEALRVATGWENLPEDPESWWTAWADYNELYTPSHDEPQETYTFQDFVYYYPQLPVPQYRPEPVRHGYQPDYSRTPRRGRWPVESVTLRRDGSFDVTYGYRSCFLAGTPVWTQAGPVEIERIQPGDLVLSQEPETGELSYRPVLQLTVRPASELVRVNVGDEFIIATRGHRFWLDGQGWEMAKLLKPRMRLHAIEGGVAINEVVEYAESDGQEAYNLVVDDFHTYFVGQAKLLVCDNSCPRPTLAVTPGLIFESLRSGPSLAVETPEAGAGD